MIYHDLYCGIVLRYRWLCIPVSVFLFGAWQCDRLMTLIDAENTLGCMIFYLLVGEMPSQLFAEGDFLMLPFLWLLLEISCLVITVEYPNRDLGQYGLQILLRSGKRKKWWRSKCLWCTLAVLSFWICGLAALAGYCLVNHIPLTLSLSDDIISACIMNRSASSYEISSLGVLLFHLCFMPFLTSLLLNLLQMTVSLVSGRSVYGLLSASAILVYSAFLCTPFAIGNFGMLYRDSLFYQGGLDYTFGFPILILAGVILMLIGGFCFQRTNLLGSQKEEDV